MSPRDFDAGVVPDFLTVEEAAAVLRIGRTAAYQLAREFLASDGAQGIPVIRCGRQLRVPRCRLEEQLGGPLTWPLRSSSPKQQRKPATACTCAARSGSALARGRLLTGPW